MDSKDYYNLQEAYSLVYDESGEVNHYEGEELTEEMLIEQEMYGYVYGIIEGYLMSEGATEEEVEYIVENMSQELIDEGILGAALKVGAKLLKGGKLLKGAKGAISSALKSGKSATKSLGKLGSRNVTTAGAKLTPKAGSRAAQLKAKYNIGPEGSDTSAKRLIIDKARKNLSAAKADMKYRNIGSPKTVKKSEDALDRYLKAGYSKYGASSTNTWGRGNKARRRAEELKDK